VEAPAATTAVPDTSRLPHRITTAAGNAASRGGAPAPSPRARGSLTHSHQDPGAWARISSYAPPRQHEGRRPPALRD
jgi:hypothetical protein